MLKLGQNVAQTAGTNARQGLQPDFAGCGCLHDQRKTSGRRIHERYRTGIAAPIRGRKLQERTQPAESQPEFVKHHVQPRPRVKPQPVEGNARYLPPTPN